MPRDSSGNMTLSKPAFTSGTTIVSADVNSDLSDIATELTDSLSRSGKGGLLAQLKMNDGTLSLPGITFTNETASGFYRVSSQIIAWVINATERLRVFATGAKVTGTFQATGNATFDAAIVAGSGATGSPGDISAGRSSTTGYLFFGSSGTKSVGYDGTLYQMPGAALVNPAAFLVAATYASSGTLSSQTGSITLGNATHTPASGIYTITVTGMTTNGIIVSGSPGASVPVLTVPTANTLTVQTYPAGTLGDDTFSFLIAKL